VSLAIFDLDETLIDGNSPSLWSTHLGVLGWLDAESFLPGEAELVARYAAGEASLEQYLAYSLQPLVGRSVEEVAHVAAPFVEDVIEPLIFSDAMRCVAEHRAAGRRVLIISASPTFLVEAIAERLGIRDVLGTDLELQYGTYSGQLSGIPCAREGKVEKLAQWLDAQQLSLDQAHFYSDSHNDLPLLRHVPHAHVVNPDPILRAQAQALGWEVLHWR
jgi:HAD superfamily hydrolase (TIGR01490 family)